MSDKNQPVVAIVMGSHKDYDVMEEAKKVLDGFGVANEIRVISAHRTPAVCQEFAVNAAKRGIKVIIAGAGKAAHLAGVIASWTTLPVIGVPLDGGMEGIDALLSMVQMPGGVPVACMAVGKSGAINSALFAIEILALEDEGLRVKLDQFRERQAKEVIEKDEKLRRGKD
ncbi:5-(carboxyamino)imidazole ribonucleotide mutase [candidate division WOR-3 bacterium]|nr:5-(carboxyamino)imidazole ribonucleotide mutase [candidate division WOR-3 bacterium]